MRRIAYILCAVLAVAAWSCKEKFTDNPLENRRPSTYLWLYPPPDSTVGVGVSRQNLRWWGEDPDGVVVGFLFAYAEFPQRVTRIPSPDTLRYTWTTKNDTTILFPLDTLFRNYTVIVRAVDNTFGTIPHLSIVRFSGGPYWDRNDNGIFDAGDERLPALAGAVDLNGVVQTFPIRNTPPTLAFSLDPNEPSRVMKQPDTTYTAATFSWKGSDADGDNTLSSYRIALNDTSDPSRWLTLPIRDTVVTLVVPRARSDSAAAEVEADVYGGRFLGRQFLGRVRGLRLDALNVLYVQVKDVAGEFSPALRMPSGTNHWYVRRPRGKLLMVVDYINSDSSDALTTYGNALATVPGFENVDRLNIGRGLTAASKANARVGVLVPPFIDPALIHTFLMYDVVFWYTDQYPSLGVAQLTLFPYLQNGGKVLFSTTFQTSADPRGALNDFAPIDSISSGSTTAPFPRLVDTRLPQNLPIVPDSSVPTNLYPPLALNDGPFEHSVFMRPVYKRSDAQYIYRLAPDPRNPRRYLGTPNIGVVDGQRSIVFIGLPLHLMNNTTVGNPQGVGAFFSKTLLESFNPSRSIDRRKF